MRILAALFLAACSSTAASAPQPPQDASATPADPCDGAQLADACTGRLEPAAYGVAIECTETAEHTPWRRAADGTVTRRPGEMTGCVRVEAISAMCCPPAP